MSFAVMGMTHCRKCGSPLSDNEWGICNSCEKEVEEERKKSEIEERNRIKKLERKEQAEKDKILSIFYNMNEYEMKALEEFIHQIGKEYKKKATLEKIEKLKKELEKEDE